jgi:mono/diheme cytochrome c family protein
MRYIFLIFALCVVVTVSIAGRRGTPFRRPPIELFADMVRQPKYRPQVPNDLFPDDRASRLPIPGTIAWDDHYEDTPVNTGRVPGTTNFVQVLPVPVTAQLLARGQQRFNINCSPCHGAQADGKGITTRLGMAGVADLHQVRIVEMADGELFNTITYGKNLMGPYGANVVVEDRWAIIAYLRALQLSQLATIDDVPQDMRAKLGK